MVTDDNNPLGAGERTPNNPKDSSTTENLLVGCKSVGGSSGFRFGVRKLLEPLSGIRPSRELVESAESGTA